MKERVVATVALVFLFALVSTYAQTTDFFELVKTGTPQSVQAAINQGADVNARDRYGLTPLMFAAQYNQDSKVVATLLEAGANLNARNRYGWVSLLYAAASNRNPEVVGVLLKAGAHINARDRYGLTPLMFAASSNQSAEVISTLLKAGAQVNAQDAAGLSPLMCAAASNQNPAVITILLEPIRKRLSVVVWGRLDSLGGEDGRPNNGDRNEILLVGCGVDTSHATAAAA